MTIKCIIDIKILKWYLKNLKSVLKTSNSDVNKQNK